MNMEIGKYDEPTYKLTWVGARDACAKHIQKSAVYLFCDQTDLLGVFFWQIAACSQTLSS